jgi:hypothetical protein
MGKSRRFRDLCYQLFQNREFYAAALSRERKQCLRLALQIPQRHADSPVALKLTLDICFLRADDTVL